ncbi:Ionotropic receptor 68a, partial [Frankliniella occidentalis]
MLARATETTSDAELAALLRVLVQRVDEDLNCLALIGDALHQHVFGRLFFKKLGLVPVFKVTVQDGEDLLSPNYRTLKAIRQVRKEGCRAYFLLFANGIQLGRLLRFGDSQRVLDTRGRFVVLHDRRLFSPDLHYLWKKIVNVVFVRRPPLVVVRAVHGTVPRAHPGRDGDEAPRHLAQGRLPAERRSFQVMQALARAMNFVPRLYEAPGASREQWGRRQLDGSLSGLLGEVTSGRAELVLGDLHYSPFHLRLMDLSVPYHSECLTFLTPEATTDNSWQTLILPFKPEMWLAVGLALAAGGLTFFVLARCGPAGDEDASRSTPPAATVRAAAAAGGAEETTEERRQRLR